LELEEGLYTVGGHEDFNKFYGIVRQIRPSLRSGQNIVVITAFDYIVKLEDWEIEKEFEASKVAVANEILDPVYLPQPGMAQIFNADHNDWAEHPFPTIFIKNKTSNANEEPMWQGFEINYEEGQVILGTAINTNNFDIKCSYHYYPSGKFVEDIIEEIITIPDGYGYSFSTSTYLRESFTSFTGLSTDVMTPNYAEETIDGTTYAAGRLWYLSYNNLTTTLGSGNFTVPGASIQAIDKRYGRIRLNHSISLTAVVTCNVNYTFKTIQATGIEVPYINFTSRKTKNRFEALRQIRELVAPNYLIRTIGTKKIWATYINQKYNPDYELKLPTAMSYAEDQDIYTRVKVFGKNLNPTNLMLGRDVHFEEMEELYRGYAYNQELSYAAGWGTVPVPPGSTLIYDTVDFDSWRPQSSDGRNTIATSGYRIPPNCLKFGTNEAEGGPCSWVEFYHHLINWTEDGYVRGSFLSPRINVDPTITSPKIILKFTAKVTKCGEVPRNTDDSVGPKYIRAIIWQHYNSPYIPSIPVIKEMYPGGAAGGLGGTDGWGMELSANLTIWPGVKYITVQIDCCQDWFELLTPFWNTYISRTNLYVDNCQVWLVNDYTPVPVSKEDYVTYWVWPAGSQDITLLKTPYPEVLINGVKVGSANPVHITSSGVLTLLNVTYEAVDVRRYHYTIVFSHSSIYAGKPIKVYKSDGSLFYEFPPNSEEIDYTEGSWKVADTARNEDIEMLATAEYWVQYSSSKIDFCWDKGKAAFYVHKDLLNRQQRTDIVTANFKYETILPLPGGIGLVSDGRWNTQCQLEFYGQPLKTMPLFTVDLGSSQRIDAIDMTSGFYKPDLGFGQDEVRRFDVSNWFTLKYSLNGTDFYPVCEKASNFHLGGGESVSFEEGDLPELFDARYFRLILEDSNKIDFEAGRWCVPICEFAIYKNLILKGEARLIPTHSGEDETHIYDYRDLLDTVGDKLYKIATVNPILSTQSRIDRRAGRLLEEFQKEHTKSTVDVMYAPHIELGQTVRVIDPVNSVAQNYFIEGISNNKGKPALNMAYYPGLYS